MKVFCLAPKPHANDAGLNFKSNLRPAALVHFTSRENFKNFAPSQRTSNLTAEARATNRAIGARPQGFEVRTATKREAISARRADFACRGAETAGVAPIDTTASENILNFAAREHCADRKNFKIFASDEIKFATHGELKFATRSMAKFTARRRLKFEPFGTATRDFALCDRILNPKPRKSCASFKISSRRGEKTK